ncbi:MAG TPA: DUF1028 domain-containing protein [Candidatus Limnocylindrales bacterium]|nr:DUF1028 domain-containing protein [Candidatus Limnocylindrales bacterium]
MTFSIVARDPVTGDFGIAIASRALAVGAVAPFARATVGAISTQALPNVSYGPDALERLAAGEAAESILAALTAADGLAAQRQAGIVDALGRSATWTGKSCMAWAGGRVAPGVAAQGNILAGPEVVDALMEAYASATGSFPRRLVAALRAGDQAGGDSRGRQSAALLVRRDKGGIGGLDDRWIDLRIDDHTDPVTELARLLTLHEKLTDFTDPAVLAQVGSVVVKQLSGAIKQAFAAKDVAAAASEGTLTASPGPGVPEHLRNQPG